MTKPKRLDGRKKQIAFTSQMENDLRSYCRDNGIESESELVRNAIAKYIYADYKDETLKLAALDDLRKKTEKLQDMTELLFKYLRLMHINLLCYHPEFDEDAIKDAAFKSANLRHKKFFAGFQEDVKNDPPFFERLLHDYFTEEG